MKVSNKIRNAVMDAGSGEKTCKVRFTRLMEADVKIGVISFMGYIGYGDATVETFSDKLAEFRNDGVSKLEVVMNSEGGDMFNACGIYDLLKGSGMAIDVKIYGVAASAATLVACAADKVMISENSRYMVHRARGWVNGVVEEIEQYCADLKDTENRIMSIYADRTGKSIEDIKTILDAETWMSAENAVKEGWCDEVILVEEKKDESGAGEGSGDDSASEEVKEEAPVRENRSVLKRMMVALGVSGESEDDLEAECHRLAEENARLLAENDGYRGMSSQREREMKRREEVVEREVRERVASAMAAGGVPKRELPSPSEGSNSQRTMSNEKLKNMKASEAMAWIRNNPKEASELLSEA